MWWRYGEVSPPVPSTMKSARPPHISPASPYISPISRAEHHEERVPSPLEQPVSDRAPHVGVDERARLPGQADRHAGRTAETCGLGSSCSSCSSCSPRLRLRPRRRERRLELVLHAQPRYLVQGDIIDGGLTKRQAPALARVQHLAMLESLTSLLKRL